MIPQGRMLHSIETTTNEIDFDFNERDEEMRMSQYSKDNFNYGRKSKVSQVSKANTNQIEQNLNFIENQVNLGQKGFSGINSGSKSPFSSALNNDRKTGALLSPGASANGMINIGQALASAGVPNQGQKPQIPTNTERSFFKQGVSKLVDQSQMTNTGMAGAPKAMATGSSFYNATMAKTKQQQLNAHEELQRQLEKIFNQTEKSS